LEDALEGIAALAPAPAPSAPPAESEDGFDLAAALSDPAAGPIHEPAIQDVFREFKKGIEAQIDEGEWSAHYDLAIAYREMGLVEDAAEQLTLVVRGDALRLEALTLLATCKIELGMPAEAVDLLASALEKTPDAAAAKALRYDLGEAYLAVGDRGQALAAFGLVAEEEADYREVQERIATLS